jgi:hypothetical protein
VVYVSCNPHKEIRLQISARLFRTFGNSLAAEQTAVASDNLNIYAAEGDPLF